MNEIYSYNDKTSYEYYLKVCEWCGAIYIKTFGMDKKDIWITCGNINMRDRLKNVNK
jgi:hypothetical protein